MKPSVNGSRDRIIYAVLAIFLLGYVYEEVFAGSTTTPVPVQTSTVTSAPVGLAPKDWSAVPGAAVGAPAAKRVGTNAAALDPTLYPEAMLVSEAVAYSGTGRNIFSPASMPAVPIPNPIARARPLAPVAFVAPQPTGPPPPPPIDLKFFGVATAGDGRRQAFLLHGDSVLTAIAGDVVLRRYRVVAVDAKSMQVEDMQNNNRQTLPLLVN